MARKRPSRTSGTVVTLQHRSKILADNPLGDPVERTLGVWLPHEYDRNATHGRGQRFPVLYDLVGFTGTGIAHLNWKPFSENVAERAARLVRDQRMGPVIIVFPDCFTSLGGNQYVNSPAIGRYADFLLDEVIPLVDREFRTLASRGSSTRRRWGRRSSCFRTASRRSAAISTSTRPRSARMPIT